MLFIFLSGSSLMFFLSAWVSFRIISHFTLRTFAQNFLSGFSFRIISHGFLQAFQCQPSLGIMFFAGVMVTNFAFNIGYDFPILCRLNLE